MRDVAAFGIEFKDAAPLDHSFLEEFIHFRTHIRVDEDYEVNNRFALFAIIEIFS